METENNGDGELHNREPAALGCPQAKFDRAIQALDSTKDLYAQEVLRLRALNEAIPIKRSRQTMEGFLECTEELPPCPALLRNLLQERQILSEELQQQKGRCEELQTKLEQEHAEKLEAQICLNVLNETISAALQGEKFLVEQNRHLALGQQVLSSKLEEVSKASLPAFQSQIKDVEAVCNSTKQEDLAVVLYKKVRIRGLWVFAEFILFFHAMLWCLLRTLKETYNIAPT